MVELRTAALAAALLAVPLDSGWAQRVNNDELAIREVLAEYRAATYPLDTARLRAIHGPEVLVVDGGVLLRNRQQLMDFLQTALRGPSDGWRFTALDIVEIRFVTPTTAIALATWEGGVPTRPPGKGIWLATLGKQGGRWLFQGWASARPAN